MLSAIVFLPLAGALAIATIARSDRQVKYIAVAVAAADLVLALVAFFGMYDTDGARFQLLQGPYRWIPLINVHYFLGVDGLSMPLVLLTGLLGFTAVLASWNISLRVREYFVWLLVLQTAVMGVFASLDFVLFFLFWELELIPMYFLISIWGSGRKEYSALKFLIFTLLGSAFMLVAILILFLNTGTFVKRDGEWTEEEREERAPAAASTSSSGSSNFAEDTSDPVRMYLQETRAGLSTPGRCWCPCPWSSGSSSWPSPSNCPPGRCTPGCPTPTPMPPRR